MRPSPRASRARSPDRIHRPPRRCKDGSLRSRRSRSTSLRAREGLARPPAWRYWRALPPKGRIGIFLNAWYTEIVAARVEGKLDKAEFEFYLQETRSYERMLFDEGFILLKFWIHLSKSASRERLQEIERKGRPRKSPYKVDFKHARAY